jgi:hypothetical protein
MSADLSNLSSYLSTELESTLGDFVFIDKQNQEGHPSNNACPTSFSPLYIFKMLLIVIPIGVMFKYLIDWNDIVALYIEFAFLLIQLVFVLDKIPGMRLDTKSYLSGPTITGALEEIKTNMGGYCFKKSHYVVLYHTTNNDGRPISIRKTLQAGILDGNLVDEKKGNYDVLTDLACKEGAPFSAFPRSTVRKLHKRYRRWIRYLMPILVVTCLAIICNLYYSCRGKQARINHSELIKPVFIVNAVLYTIVLPPLIYCIRRWHQDVNNGGHETNDVKSLCHGI